ncbi:SAV_2336 N-terminal domain-related protein [Streptomyces sp. 8N616]|uniref:SAV_2336 N-terminal domain-related protein n=1 Tax=Streptomyces sp. 8N616 TaxID=3457414 RepID=UPI003FD018FC
MRAVLGDSGVDLSHQELLDALWLARLIPAGDGDAPLTRAASRRPGLPLNPAPRSVRPLDAPGPSPQPAEPAGPPEPSGPRGRQRSTPTPPASAARPAPRTAATDLYAARGGTGPAPSDRAPSEPAGTRAVPVSLPEGKALGSELAVGRALRALKQHRPSVSRLEFDEEATAASHAETGLPYVVLRPARERWLDLALVVDDGMSMLLWQRLAAELRTMLQRLGAFRVVRTYGLHTRGGNAPLVRGRPFDPDAPALPPQLLADPSGRTLVLVLSDGMGAAWRDGRMHNALVRWACCGPTAVVHALPRRLWSGSGLRAERWHVTSRRRGSANVDWTASDPVLPAELAEFNGLPVPVPVLEPSPGPMGAWARLLGSRGAGALLPLLGNPGLRRSGTRDRAEIRTADDEVRQVQHFRDAASPEAFRLAAHLSAVAPVSLPVMRLVQSAVPWRADTGHLAEVFLGGLMHPAVGSPARGPLPLQHRVFDFTEAARGALLDAVPTAELMNTGRHVGRRLEQLAGRSPDFPAWLARSDGTESLPAGQRAFAGVGRHLSARFGAPSGPHQAPPQAGIPESLGRYELRGPAGSGSDAYLADGPDGEPVLVRLASPSGSRSAVKRIRTQAEALRRMDGRHAPQLLGQGLDDDPPWIAEEFLLDSDGSPASSLTRLLAGTHGDLDAVTAAKIGASVANAVTVCLGRRMVHSNLTSDTVFVADGIAKLTGWETTVIDGRSSTLSRRRPPTAESNVFALGLILLALGGGAPDRWWPKGGQSHAFALPRWQGPEWERVHGVVVACLHATPASRPTAQDVAETFGLRLYGSAPPPPPPAAEFIGPPPRRPRPPELPSPPAEMAVEPGPVARRLKGWASRFGIGEARPARERRLAMIRSPLPTPHRIAVAGLDGQVDKTATIAVLGSILASERAHRTIAVDTGSTASALRGRMRRQTRAYFHEVASAIPALGTYANIRQLTSRSRYGLDVLAPDSALGDSGGLSGEDYRRLLSMLGVHYPITLIDLGGDLSEHAVSGFLGPGHGLGLDLADQLIIVTAPGRDGTGSGWSTVERMISCGYENLLRQSITVVTGHGRTWDERPVPHVAAHCRAVVTVPHDEHLGAGGELVLDRLQPRTLDAYLELAALVTGDDGWP